MTRITRPRHDGRSRRGGSIGLALALLVTALAAVALTAAPASAATTTLDEPTTLSGQTPLGTTSFAAISVSGVVLTGDVDTSLEWTQAALLGVEFDPNLVRQGRELDPMDSYTRVGSGSMTVKANVNDLELSWLAIGPLDLPDVTFNALDGACALRAGGGTYECNLASDRIALINPPDPVFGLRLPGPYVDLRVVSKVTVTPEGLDTLRTASFGGNPAGTANLTLGESPITDDFSVPCNVGAGDTLTYALGSVATSPGVTVETSLQLVVGVAIPVGIPPTVDIDFASPTFPLDTENTSIPISGAGASFDLGPVQANNIQPTIDPLGPFAGQEGTPIAFSASTTSQCPITGYVWSFSNGTTSFGPSPQRTFLDDGLLDGQLTVTDQTGLTATRSFTVDVDNVNPVANAGPDDSEDWGRPVQFNGQATDPGSADSLEYEWSFGDGTPSATGGPSVSHVYAQPGSYVATFSVTDDDGGVDTDTRTVTVTKRGTTLSYTGDLSGTYDTASSLGASLVDEYGQAVSGRLVSFQVGSEGPFGATTSGTGAASRSYTPGLSAGSYASTVTFAAGDPLYEGSVANFSFAVAPKATTVTYTGALSGGPNKTVALSAVLKDATGKALAGRTIVFVLGTQTANAVTDATGVASTTLKLDQKNGTYTVTATYAPAGGDAGLYVGDSDSGTFSLGGGGNK